MSEEVIAHIRDRIARMRKVMERAHDPVMIQMIKDMIKEAESDIRRLESEPPTQTIDVPPAPNGG